MNKIQITKSLSFVFIFSFALFFAACDESSSPEKAKAEGGELAETVEEAEGAEAAKEAIKRKDEEEAKAGEEHKEKHSDRAMGESFAKSSTGFKRR